MLTPIKKLLEDNAFYIALLITIGIGVLSFIKMPNDGFSVSSSDKLYHGVAYFFLTIFWLYTILKDEGFYAKIKYVILGCLIYGIIIEVLQTAITSYRTASYLDILANSTGIVLAVLAFHLFEKKIRFN